MCDGRHQKLVQYPNEWARFCTHDVDHLLWPTLKGADSEQCEHGLCNIIKVEVIVGPFTVVQLGFCDISFLEDYVLALALLLRHLAAVRTLKERALEMEFNCVITLLWCLQCLTDLSSNTHCIMCYCSLNIQRMFPGCQLCYYKGLMITRDVCKTFISRPCTKFLKMWEIQNGHHGC